MDLPRFKYHPDPVATGSVEPSANTCLVCGQARGYIYVGPVYADEEIEEAICPWCIADGSAATEYNASFTEAAGLGSWEEVPAEVVDEVAARTPGFAAWQGERWFAHCGDAAAFLGPMGYQELRPYGPDATAAIEECLDFVEADERQDFMHSLRKEEGPTAYLFKCLHCGQYGGYVDFS